MVLDCIDFYSLPSFLLLTCDTESIYLPIRLNPHGGYHSGIQENEVLGWGGVS